MAVTREVFNELDVPNLLAGSLNDDLRLSKAARKTGRKIAFVRSLILPTPIDFTWGGFFEFVRRQYTQVKFFSPILYTGVNLVFAFYMLGLVSIIGAIVYGYFFAWIPVAAAYVIDQFRALARPAGLSLALSRQRHPAAALRNELARAHADSLVDVPALDPPREHLDAEPHHLGWHRYQILSKSKTRVLHRTPQPSTLPAGAPGLAMIGALHDLRRGSMTQPIRPVRLPAEPVATFTVAGEGTGITVTETTAETTAKPVAETSPAATLDIAATVETAQAERAPGAPTVTDIAPVPLAAVPVRLPRSFRSPRRSGAAVARAVRAPVRGIAVPVPRSRRSWRKPA